jgi:hypothetical protein
MSGDPAESHPSSFQLNEEPDVVRHQAPPTQHLHPEEIGSRQHVHMPTDEILPCGRLTPFGRRFDIVAAQDIADGLIGEVMAQVPALANIRFVDPPGAVGRFQFPPASLVQFECVALHPAPNGGVVSRETSFDEQLLDVPIRKREP